MNIEDMIMNGASEEEIQIALNQIKAEKARQEQALRAKSDKEALKAEARAYLINALVAYSEAFDIGDGEWTQEEIDKIEAALKKFEEMIPLYIKMIELQGELDLSSFGFGVI